ncbi:MAG: hypothetical protein MAG795_00500 [Candidatus Woesearchaeota archaeon]|nr:hypothetical protein [Candidatus Woesearchaeota archaeon]
MIWFLKKKIEYSDLEDWIKTKKHSIRKKHSQKIKKFEKKINKEIKQAYSNLEILNKAELPNPDIKKRAVQIMQGNRDAYIQKTKSFLENIEKGFEDYESNLESYSQSTAKAFYVLKEFFANEAGKVAESIRIIDENYKKIKKASPQFNEVADIEQAWRDYKEAKMHNIRYNEKRKDFKLRMDKLSKSKKKLETEIKSLKNSKSWAQYQQQIKEKKELIQELEKIKHGIVSKFAVLERPLKKYGKISLSAKIIENYLEKPFDSLLKDKDLEIFDVLQTLKEKVLEEKIDIKDRKVEKTKKIINSLDIEYLNSTRIKYKKVKNSIQTLEKAIKSHSAKLRLKELEYKLEHILEKISKTESEKTKLEKIDEDKLKENLIKITDKSNIKIIWQK